MTRQKKVNKVKSIDKHTSTHEDKDGETWNCVFDRCFLIGTTYVIIKDFPEQTDI